MKTRKRLHMTTQPKGGVGKTLITLIYSQYLHSQNHGGVRAIFDMDTQNQSLSDFEGLKAIELPLKDEDGRIDPIKYDQFMVAVLDDSPGSVIADVGSGTLMSLMDYMTDNDGFAMLKDAGVEIVLHVPVTGGQALDSTFRGLVDISQQLGSAGRIIVWLNQHWGKIEWDGKPFEELPVYEMVKSDIDAIIVIPMANKDLLGKDLSLMTSHKLTFDEIKVSPLFDIMRQQRIKNFRSAIWDQLAAIDL